MKLETCTAEHVHGEISHPTITALFSMSASSKGVIFDTRGSGVQSSTNSSTSCRRQSDQLSTSNCNMASLQTSSESVT